jgi:hypothetical protein
MILTVRQYAGTRYGILKTRWRKDKQVEMTNFYSDSRNVLVIMPQDSQASEVAITVVRFLEKKFKGRDCIVVAATQGANLVSKYTGAEVVRMRDDDIGFFYLPKKSFIKRFAKRQFDLVVDLNLGFVLFGAYLSRSVISRYRVSFAKKYGDLFYNIQYRSVSGQSKQITYNSLCDFLEKF